MKCFFRNGVEARVCRKSKGVGENLAKTYFRCHAIPLCILTASFHVQVPIFHKRVMHLHHETHQMLYYSDENLMDPYNLAICFGPTLVPIPTDRDQVQYQNLVNELIKNFIIFNEDIFPNDGLGTVYEKYISNEPDFVG